MVVVSSDTVHILHMESHPQLLSSKYTTTDSNTSVLPYTHSTPADMTTIDFQWGRVDRLPLPANSVQTGDGTLIIKLGVNCFKSPLSLNRSILFANQACLL